MDVNTVFKYFLYHETIVFSQHMRRLVGVFSLANCHQPGLKHARYWDKAAKCSYTFLCFLALPFLRLQVRY